MIESLKKNETFEYQKLSQDEMQKRGILGRLVGPCADFINPTRNGRKYNEDLWEKVFKNPIMQEKISNGVVLGELGHPADRTETDISKVAIALREMPKKNSDGQLIAVFDILDTPNGRILKTLVDYGSTVGISSRGTGDVVLDDMGEDMVDPDTYEFETWDVVLVPAVESARLKYVTESLDNKKLNLKMALTEELNSASADDRRVMEKTLQELNIDVDAENESTPKKDGYRTSKEKSEEEQTIEKSEEANGDGSEELIKSLQDALKVNVKLEAQVKSLQEKLAVNDIEAGKVNEELGKYKQALARLSNVVSEKKALQEQVKAQKEELEKKELTIESQKQRVKKLVESSRSSAGAKAKELNELTESISVKNNEVARLTESLASQKTEYEERIKGLTESVETLKADSATKEAEMLKKLNRVEKLKENYKNLANETVSHYIESKAAMLGITANEIKNRLPESYSVKDVDEICEELQSYELNISKLPFNVDRKVKVAVRESRNETLRVDKGIDDDIDDSLLSLAGLKK